MLTTSHPEYPVLVFILTQVLDPVMKLPSVKYLKVHVRDTDSVTKDVTLDRNACLYRGLPSHNDGVAHWLESQSGRGPWNSGF